MKKGILSLLLLSLASMACLSSLPVEPAPAVLVEVAKGVNTPASIGFPCPFPIVVTCFLCFAIF